MINMRTEKKTKKESRNVWNLEPFKKKKEFLAILPRIDFFVNSPVWNALFRENNKYLLQCNTDALSYRRIQLSQVYDGGGGGE